jgi:hypothetical protein
MLNVECARFIVQQKSVVMFDMVDVKQQIEKGSCGVVYGMADINIKTWGNKLEASPCPASFSDQMTLTLLLKATLRNTTTLQRTTQTYMGCVCKPIR